MSGRKKLLSLFVIVLALAALPAVGAAKDTHQARESKAKAETSPPKAQKVTSTGSVTINGQAIHYKAVAGTIILTNGDEKPTASMFYVAYLKEGVANLSRRPVTFLYNGGPGSSTVWLHMGAFGPRRVVTSDHSHTNPAPYQLINNEDSLLDASDLVFIDAPGTGFSRIIGKEQGGAGTTKDFYGVDPDGRAFAQFITRFLSEYGRWNSPKYLFGESYGTTRSAVVANLLETRHDVDLNGVILLSSILNWDASNVDDPQLNMGTNLPYELALPTYAATAWYHKKLPRQPEALQPFLKEVETFATGDYARALDQGSELSADAKRGIAEKLHAYTGLSVAYWLKADLRVNGGQFEKELLGDSDTSTGRLDTRFTGPTMDPLSEESHYDPQAAAISSAYVAVFNDYVRKDLHYGKDQRYMPEAPLWTKWDFQHQPPGSHRPAAITTNVVPDLMVAMKYNPDLKVMLNGGYFDIATPFYAAIYTMHQIPLEPRLAKNIEYHFYESGHMVYVHTPSLVKLHDAVAKFIASTSGAEH